LYQPCNSKADSKERISNVTESKLTGTPLAAIIRPMSHHGAQLRWTKQNKTDKQINGIIIIYTPDKLITLVQLGILRSQVLHHSVKSWRDHKNLVVSASWRPCSLPNLSERFSSRVKLSPFL
jgi:hypothetical protein